MQELIEAFEVIKQAKKPLRAVDNKFRKLILLHLAKNKKMSVTDIYEQLQMEQSVVSSNLAELLKYGFVNMQKSGRQRLYSINQKGITKLKDIAEKLAHFNK